VSCSIASSSSPPTYRFARFLLVRLHLDSLSTKTTLRKFKTTLETLSDDINETYDEIWKRIKTQNPDDADLAERVIYWIFHATRPLTVPELQHALAVELGDTFLDEDNITDEDLMVSVCVGTVVVQRESHTLGLVHATTQEYFERKAAEYFPDAQRQILKVCLTYLSFEEFESGPCNSDEAVEARLRHRPLLQYAARRWGFHAMGALEQSEETPILEFLNQRSKMTTSLQISHIRANKVKRYTQFYPKNASALWVAAYFGLSRIAKLLLDRGDEHDENDEFGVRPLDLAASRGHENVVRLLLQYKSNRDINTAFHHAAWSGHQAVMRILLDNGADIDAPNKIGMTALHLASQMGHEQLTRFLLEKGANIALKTDHNNDALYLAARSGNTAVTQVLLEHGKDFLYETGVYVKALHIASKKFHTFVVNLLFDNLDKAKPVDQQGRNLLHLASAMDILGLVDRKLGDGMNPRDLDKQKRTSLHHAAASGSPEIVARLLQEGVDPGQADVDHWTSLHWAVRGGEEANIKLLRNAMGDSAPPGIMLRRPASGLGTNQDQVLSHVEILMKIYEALTPGGISTPETNPNPAQPLSLFRSVISLKMKTKEVIDSLLHPGIQCDGCNLVS
jgi:ankyrin repeat protein